jgi:hypothetical protein
MSRVNRGPFGAINSIMAERLHPVGLDIFGWFLVPNAEFRFGRDQEMENYPAVLIGNRPMNGAHRMWPVFSVSPEYSDGEAQPLDRWTRRVIEPIAGEFGAEAVFPFGEPVYPFERWGQQATGQQQSPLGILIDPDHGLWSAFRAVLIFSDWFDIPATDQAAYPCESCTEKPCLSACPVAAYTGTDFKVGQCLAHLSTDYEPRCLDTGCQARAACPVGLAYSPEQIQFHMAAFDNAARPGPNG